MQLSSLSTRLLALMMPSARNRCGCLWGPTISDMADIACQLAIVNTVFLTVNNIVFLTDGSLKLIQVCHWHRCRRLSFKVTLCQWTGTRLVGFEPIVDCEPISGTVLLSGVWLYAESDWVAVNLQSASEWETQWVCCLSVERLLWLLWLLWLVSSH